DWADDHARLNAAARALDELITDIEASRRDEDDAELRDEFALAKARRLSVQFERKRAEAGIAIGCQLLGGYGPDAQPAAAWLLSQTEGEEKPWQAVAGINLARILQPK